MGFEASGWCPKGRRAEDGPLGSHYPLTETPQARYIQRTTWNVRDSDATLIVAQRPLSGGTAATERLTISRGEPCLVVHPDDAEAITDVRAWLDDNAIDTLNIAGPRQRPDLDSYDDCDRLLRALFEGC
ncbi:MAG: putative molybdenum carrier protein [Alphaproteobacteria bacterium]|nr:putative molybdenum carrier protein [Alphaproteobacteria bacterium]